jgi:hypothetical protein
VPTSQTALSPPLAAVVTHARVRELILQMDCLETLAIHETPIADTPAEWAYVDEVIAADTDAIRRGCSVRGLALPQVCSSPVDRHVFDAIDAVGGEHRLLRKPVRKILVVDRRVAVVEAGIADHALLLTAPGAVAAMVAVFDALWTQSLARRARRPRPDDDLLIDLLAQGKTDPAAARALGVSERTLRRRVAVLMDEHGARSRLELGLVLGRGTQ